ncbi:GNAT family N-acetyltransferase [Streptomyces sp. HUAS MG47]|uniref:GNAT family N-acetyltransferase n=1 Tax=Streptomyces solicamelliae TaxID=3231716 RepID=UPI00387835C1
MRAVVGTTVIETGALREEDRVAWEVLARGYKAFYRTEVPAEGYEATWHGIRHDPELQGIGAWSDGKLVGIAHYLFHRTFWLDDSCYLQDLFVAESARGQGVARMLIETVAEAARERGAARLYWTTQEGNATARALYDKVASFNGFLRYDYPVTGG